MRRQLNLMLGAAGLAVCAGALTAVVAEERPNLVAVASEENKAVIFPEEQGALITYWGYDIKRDDWIQRLTRVKAHQVFVTDNMNLLRVPIWGDAQRPAHPEAGVVVESYYNDVLAAMDNARRARPDVTFFASKKLRGQETFPDWVKDSSGVIPSQYAIMVADFLEFMEQRGFPIDVLGVDNEIEYNEGNITASRYRQIVDELHVLAVERGFTIPLLIAPETFGPGLGASWLDTLFSNGWEDRVDIAGVHYYPQRRFRNQFADFSAAARSLPKWHSEVHWTSAENLNVDTEIARMEGNLAPIFDSFDEGFTGMSWWSYRRDGLHGSIRRAISSSTINARPVTITDHVGPEVAINTFTTRAFRRGRELIVWVLNNTPENHPQYSLVIDGDSIAGQVTYTRWTETGEVLGTVEGEGNAVSLDFPARTITMVRLELAKADGDWIGSSGNWSDPENWLEGKVAGGSGATANFALPSSDPRFVALMNAVSLERLIVNNPDGGILTLGDPLLDGNRGSLILASEEGSPTFDVAGAGQSLVLNAPVLAETGFVKRGEGSLILASPLRPEPVFTFNYTNLDAMTAAGGRRYTTFNGGDDVGDGSMAATNSNQGTSNPGPGFFYIPVNVAWKPNTSYSIDLEVGDRPNQPDDAILEYGLWDGLPEDDAGPGVFDFDNGETTVSPWIASSRPSLGVEGRITIVDLGDGNTEMVGDLTGTTATDSAFHFFTGADVSHLGEMVLFLRAGLKGLPTGLRTHWDNISLYAYPLESGLEPEDSDGVASKDIGGVVLIEEGTLTLSYPSALETASEISVAEEGVLRLPANGFVLGEGQILTGAGSVFGAMAVEGEIGPGGTGGGATQSLTVEDITFAPSGAFGVTFDSSQGMGASLTASGQVSLNLAELLLNDLAQAPEIPPAGSRIVLVDYSQGSLSGTFSGLPDGAEVQVGENAWVLRYADNSGDGWTRGAFVTLAAPEQSPFEVWANEAGLTGENNLPGEDPDGDGIPNGLEFLLMGNPLKAGVGVLPRSRQSGDQIEFEFQRRIENGGIKLEAGWSYDLVTWHDLDLATGATEEGGPAFEIGVTEATLPDSETVVVSAPIGGDEAETLFLRLRLAQAN